LQRSYIQEMHEKNELKVNATLSHFSMVEPNLISLLIAKVLGLQKAELIFINLYIYTYTHI